MQQSQARGIAQAVHPAEQCRRLIWGGFVHPYIRMDCSNWRWQSQANATEAETFRATGIRYRPMKIAVRMHRLAGEHARRLHQQDAGLANRAQNDLAVS